LVCSWPPTPALVDAAALPFAAADHELKRYYERTRRSVVNSMSR
jgi:hypothetical protein